ncbi:hypothetical protein OSH11_00135 [Kaistia dalseonensis]|uniref:DUF4333 domain-containing protein n=1 Tax=Kaistia dalseonensis TaxID=410840 RepID=A0ABU0H175_9HYPH|nr:hypothetical protein [Kaistia dalseonensis]MCX5493103.1 hypothetical protein [Kaistia dalseonensis]MDQ0435658.1 hypothetical protein [Kaistia dalseonensis]
MWRELVVYSALFGAAAALGLSLLLPANSTTPSADMVEQLVQSTLDQSASDIEVSRCETVGDADGVRCEVIWDSHRYGELVIRSLLLEKAAGGWRITESHPI